MIKDSLGDRIKRYERVSNPSLTPRSAVIIRVDGKAFHTFTKGCQKPFDQRLISAMTYAAKATAKEMSGFKLAYTQSDECTFVITDFDTLETQGWFNYELNKIVSISASCFSVAFNRAYGSNNALFDSRAFVVPRDEVANVFIWRQRDWQRNSVQMLARHYFAHGELQGKKTDEIKQMLIDEGFSWNNLPNQLRQGTFITRELEERYFDANYNLLVDNHLHFV